MQCALFALEECHTNKPGTCGTQQFFDELSGREQVHVHVCIYRGRMTSVPSVIFESAFSPSVSLFTVQQQSGLFVVYLEQMLREHNSFRPRDSA